MHGRPELRRAGLTGLALQAWPRPAGRSGWVKHGANAVSRQRVERRNGELRRAGEAQPQGGKIGAQGSKEPARNGGRAKRRRRTSFLARGSLPALFFQPPANQLPLELGEIIDEQLAFEMIHLMLDADGEQPLRIHFERFAVPAQRAHANMRGARQLVIDARAATNSPLRRDPSLPLQQLGLISTSGCRESR
jgi:hypothetical protein